jgi:di/tricarboxylate transporter
MSNVPAAILLAEHSDDTRLIAYAVDVGGFGLAIGSLANLIALRMLRSRRAWLMFHGFSLPFLLASTLLVYLWLFAR